MRFMYLIVRMLVLLSLAACFALNKSSVVEKREVENRGIASDLNGVSSTGSIPSFSFVRIPAVKEFMMGSPVGEPFRVPRKEAQVPVEISKAFMMMTTEVTQRQYFQVTRQRPSKFKRKGDCPGSWDRVNRICPDHPVEGVSWYETQDFIKELNRLVGLRGCLGSPKDPRGCYRLPTEAEWEWAVRAGTETAYFFGNDSSQLGRYAVYTENSGGRTHKVRGNRLANPWGLYDVYEMCGSGFKVLTDKSCLGAKIPWLKMDLTVFFVAVVGATTRSSCDQPIAAGTFLATGTTMSVFAS